MEVIARIHTDFPTKFGLPRQSGLVETLKGRVVFEPKYRDPNALKGLEGFSHVWLIWQFSESMRDDWSPTVRPPRLGGNATMGVFATRSPFRPNPIGLSCVRLDGVDWDAPDGPALLVSGADMMDGTPIWDVKPYLPYADCRPDAVGGFADAVRDYEVSVCVPPELLSRVPEDKREGLLGALRQDPRPGYRRGDARRFGLTYAGLEVRFTVQDGCLTVCEICDSGTLQGDASI